VAEKQGDVPITLTKDEALVLFEWLSHEVEIGRFDQLLRDAPADWVALHRLLAHLESTLGEPFHPDYKKVLTAARDRLRLAAPTI
jgi:hypothetical protein